MIVRYNIILSQTEEKKIYKARKINLEILRLLTLIPKFRDMINDIRDRFRPLMDAWGEEDTKKWQKALEMLSSVNTELSEHLLDSYRRYTSQEISGAECMRREREAYEKFSELAEWQSAIQKILRTFQLSHNFSEQIGQYILTNTFSDGPLNFSIGQDSENATVVLNFYAPITKEEREIAFEVANKLTRKVHPKDKWSERRKLHKNLDKYITVWEASKDKVTYRRYPDSKIETDNDILEKVFPQIGVASLSTKERKKLVGKMGTYRNRLVKLIGSMFPHDTLGNL